ncbi:MAG: RNase H family protein [Pseudomonadota bacterium]
MITKLYADGGVIQKNPSEIGGTWAWIMVNELDQHVDSSWGTITPAEARMPAITNNLTEMLALICGLERLPANFAGTVYSDSKISLGRLHWGWKWSNIPTWMHRRFTSAITRLDNWDMDRIQFIHLDGHPTQEQLASGIGKCGNPVSAWNVRCDKLCEEAGRDYQRSQSVIGFIPKMA